MPIPTVITDLSTTAASNSPLGSEPPTQGDDHIRALASIIRREHDNFADTASTANGDALIAVKKTVSGAVGTTQHVVNENRPLCVKTDFGATGDGVTDDSAAIQAAFNSNASLYFPPGVYLVDPIAVPSAAKGSVYSGAGFWHYGSTAQVVIKARTAAQASIFTLANGADNLTFQNMRLEGDSKAAAGIDATYGAFLTLEGVGVYNCTSYGVYAKQGLGRYRRCFFQNAAVGLHLYSDSTVTDSEFTGGTIPLLIVAGGNQISNVWANSGSTCQVRLAPFDASTTLINTSIVSLYTGETASATSAPIIDVAGTSSQSVQQLRITSSHLVHAVAAGSTINGMINISYGKDVVINGNVMLGQGPSAAAGRYTDYAVKMANSTSVSITSNVVRFVNKNPINIGASCNDIHVSTNAFYDCGSTIAAGTEGAQVLISGTPVVVMTGNSIVCTNGSTVPYALEGGDAKAITFSGNMISYASATVAVPATGNMIGDWSTNAATFRSISGTQAWVSGAWNGANGGPPIYLGAYALWVDASGRLRIKSGVPSADGDGTIVGTQT